jgi:hypothetical protein
MQFRAEEVATHGVPLMAATLQLPMLIFATGGGIYTMVSIAGYIAGALLVVAAFVALRVRRAAKLAQLDGGDEREEH